MIKKDNNPIINHENNYTLLYFAALSNAYSIVHLLLQKGADPTIKTRSETNPIEMTTNDNIKELLKICTK